jgi:hypothetical protein
MEPETPPEVPPEAPEVPEGPTFQEQAEVAYPEAVAVTTVGGTIIIDW